MRHGAGLAVSSALLFLSILSAPHPVYLESSTEAVTENIVISEFYPCALCSDEYFVLQNVGPSQVNLRNWSVTDGEGTLRFKSDQLVPPNMIVAVSTNSTSFLRAFGKGPDIVIPCEEKILSSGTFKLADVGDTLELKRPDGSSADAVAYGDVPVPSSGWNGPPIPRIHQGEVAKRIVVGTIPNDTDRCIDWCPFREYRYGFTETPSFVCTVPPGSITAFVSPDCSLECILSVIDSARGSLRICTYEVGSVPICLALVRAHDRGVDIQLLVDGAPAGGLNKDEVECLSALHGSGIRVLCVNGNLTERSVQHIGALHAKYLIVDHEVSVVMSENLVRSGFPRDGIYGNRGWGAVVADPSLASYLGRLFDSDSRIDRPDVRDWGYDPRYNASATLPPETNSTVGCSVLTPFRTSSISVVHAIVSPDASVAVPYLSPLIESSKEIAISQFQADVMWESRWTGLSGMNPLAGSVITAMRAGSSARALFDSSWYNADGNKRIVSLLSGVARNESLDGEFIQLDTRSPISILHNKGVILDGSKVLISSNNWCVASFAKNRELALLIESEELAGFFLRAFEMDWMPDTNPPVAFAGLDRTAALGSTVKLDSGLSTDDRAIARWAWDVGGDGSVECDEPIFEFVPERVGRVRVVLTVTDAWDNHGTDTVYLEVVDGNRSNPWLIPGQARWWITSVAGVLGSVCGAMIARRRIRSHNVNHGGSD